MNSSISSTCEYPRFRDGKGGPWVPCGESLRYDGPEGVEHIVLWASHQGRYVGPCCFYSGRGGSVLQEQGIARYGEEKEFKAKYTPHVDNPEEEKRLALARRQFAHALSETRPERVGGLKRLDDSAAFDTDFIHMPRIRRVV